ncbi:hypothetical protein ACIPW5_13380 [Streptomyces sp. NPDC090077]|uniref:hypothetical protein n=1 Tax=Streptomyces sp. NPDC090077 TaxID=3365938 RepID=UPI0037F2746A
MKLSKAAAVVAGSVAALGAAAPAFAAEAPAGPPMSLSAGWNTALSAVEPVVASAPETLGMALAEQGDTVNKVVGTAQGVNKLRNNAPGEVLGVANEASKVSPLLGGVKLNGGQN